MRHLAHIIVFAIGLFMPVVANAAEPDLLTQVRELTDKVMARHMQAPAETCRDMLSGIFFKAASRNTFGDRFVMPDAYAAFLARLPRDDFRWQWQAASQSGCIDGRAELYNADAVQIAKPARYADYLTHPGWHYDKTETKVWSRMFGDILYIRILNFYEPDLVKKVTEILLKQSFAALIVDVRGTMGGYPNVADRLVQMFAGTEDPVIFTYTRKDGRLEASVSLKAHSDPQRFSRPGMFKDKPVVVLGDRDTSSAGEYLIGMLTKNKATRGVFMGAGTYGKGTRQGILSIAGKLKVELTTEIFSFPGKYGSEVVVEGKGLEPDIPLSPAQLKVTANPGSDQAIKAALDHLNGSALNLVRR